jgi:D-alanyl-lipoteichoic acid acyltransferase DltB (MBOAT superfamily)
MLFASLDFVLFFVPVLVGYWLLAARPRARWILLLAASYFFYCATPKPASGTLPTSWAFVGLLVLSTLVDYIAARVIAETPRGGIRRRLALWLSLAVNLGLLGYFKYTGFLLQVATDISGWFGVEAALPVLRTALPIGISFYTFQSLSYTIDVWRGRLTPETNLLRFSLFVAFFPQLVAGPIVRAAEFLPQLRQPLRVDAEDVNFAVLRIGKGLVKKVVLGDFIAAYFTDIVFAAPADHSSLENLLALYAFTLQIYADFSGYSDIAIGVARLLGFRLPENFDRPYQARDVGEFWRRWHMTLSTWLRDYLFFPLGGSRGSDRRTYFNLWVTMFLVGMWHGASWNFVIYSNLQAAAMVYSRFIRLSRDRATNRAAHVLSAALGFGALALGMGLLVLELDTSSAWLLAGGLIVVTALNSLLPAAGGSALWTIAHVLMLFHFTTLSRIFFRADSLKLASQMTAKLVEWDSLGVRDGLFRIQSLHGWVQSQADTLGGLTYPLQVVSNHGILALLVAGLGYHFTPADWTERVGARLVRWLPGPALGAGIAVIALLIAQLLSGPRANIYFAF